MSSTANLSPRTGYSGRLLRRMLAGEHVAATEFVIGVMFVNWGASVRDMFLGLAIGNALAVLTWTLLCAPIAVQTRLTLYWYLRSIGGPWLTVIYNVLNAVLFCILAGCMITVSASAVRIPFGIAPQVHWYPDDCGFVLVVMVVGTVVVGLAMAGFKKLAAFSSVCSPWMFLMFIAGAVVALPQLAQQAGVAGPSDFFTIAERVVWTGRTPDGSAPMGFWSIAAFAWICNLAMHGGLSDMALFRYAKHSWYGLITAVGMFFGHYLAWICAGMMGAGRRSCCSNRSRSSIREPWPTPPSGGPASSRSSPPVGRRPIRPCTGRASRCRRSRRTGPARA